MASETITVYTCDGCGEDITEKPQVKVNISGDWMNLEETDAKDPAKRKDIYKVGEFCLKCGDTLQDWVRILFNEKKPVEPPAPAASSGKEEDIPF